MRHPLHRAFRFPHLAVVAGGIALGIGMLAPAWPSQAGDAAKTAASPVSGAVDIPLIHDGPGHRLLLPVVVNDVSGRLLVDTGAMELLLDASYAKDFKVKTRPSKAVSEGVGGKDVLQEGDVVIVAAGHEKAFRLPRKAFFGADHHQVFESSGDSGVPVFGLLGMSQMRSVGGVLDCGNGKLILHPRGEKFACPDGYQAVRCQRLGGQLLMAPVAIAGKSGMMLVDSGAQHTLLWPVFAKQADIEVSSGERAKAVGVGRKRISLKTAKMEGTKIGGVGVGDMQVFVGKIQTLMGDLVLGEDDKPLPAVGILGFDQLRRLKAFVDCRNALLYLPKEAPPALPEMNLPTTQEVNQAIQKLAAVGDKEALELVQEAMKHKGRVTFSEDRIIALVERAKAKGLMSGGAKESHMKKEADKPVKTP